MENKEEMEQKRIPERIEYGSRALELESLACEPLEQFGLWFSEAVAAGVPEPNAFCLCTTDSELGAQGRFLLMKGYDKSGLTFYTNLESSKARLLQADSRASMVFWWSSLQRQVRVFGKVEPVSEEEADLYFSSRPRASQLGAWASLQSQLLDSRRTLEERIESYSERYPDVVPRPERWGGYRLVPDGMEFWQGRDNRLHDRFLFRRVKGMNWEVERLMP